MPKHKICDCGLPGDRTCLNCGKGACHKHGGKWTKIMSEEALLYLCPDCEKEKMTPRKKPNTPRSRVRAAIRLLWMKSRERAKVLKQAEYKCADCGVKQSRAKGKKVYVEVHHNPAIDWDGIINLIFDRVLNVPQEVLCKKCHKERHEKIH